MSGDEKSNWILDFIFLRTHSAGPIRFDNSLDQEYVVQLINLHGQVIHTQRTQVSFCTVDVSVFPSGIFVLRVVADDGAVGLKKLVKE